MGDWVIWLLVAGFAFQIGCIFALSSQIQRTMQLMMALVNSQNRILLERLDRLNGGSAISAPARQPPVVERRVAQRRSPLAQAARSLASGDRRASPGRRIDDMLAATATTLRQAF